MKRVWRTLIVDDVALARRKLLRMVQAHDDIVPVGEAANSADMLLAVKQLQPDLLLLDITMPGQDGLSALASIAPALRPYVIFITAHSDYAPQAFRVDAVDYLLKPVTPELLAVALSRVRQRTMTADLCADTANREAEKNHVVSSERICVRTDQGLRLIAINSIDWIESIRNYLALHCGQETLIIRQTMHSIAAQLPIGQFQRVHRSSIVNLHSVDGLQASLNGEQRITLRDGTSISVSRGYRESLMMALKS